MNTCSAGRPSTMPGEEGEGKKDLHDPVNDVHAVLLEKLSENTLGLK